MSTFNIAPYAESARDAITAEYPSGAPQDLISREALEILAIVTRNEATLASEHDQNAALAAGATALYKKVQGFFGACGAPRFLVTTNESGRFEIDSTQQSGAIKPRWSPLLVA